MCLLLVLTISSPHSFQRKSVMLFVSLLLPISMVGSVKIDRRSLLQNIIQGMSKPLFTETNSFRCNCRISRLKLWISDFFFRLWMKKTGSLEMVPFLMKLWRQRAGASPTFNIKVYFVKWKTSCTRLQCNVFSKLEYLHRIGGLLIEDPLMIAPSASEITVAQQPSGLPWIQ